ncbi:MAG: HTH domain-containing protein [FCB group bacterium]|jgi:biotin operon repressor
MATISTGPKMLTAGKLAEQLGVSPAKVKKAIQDLKIKPDLIKANCNYYSEGTAKKIQKAIS